MKTLILSLVLLSTVACVQEKASSRNTSSGSSAEFADTASDFVTDDFDPIDEGSGTGSGLIVPTDDVLVEEDPADGLDSVCGQLYRSSANYHMIIDEADGSYHVVIADGYSADSILDSVKFPNDSYTACVWGNYNGSVAHWYYLNHIYATNIQLQGATLHPQREDNNNSYTYSYCGEITNVTGNSGTTNMEIKVGYMPYILTDNTDTLSGAISSGGGKTQGCVYGNNAATKNTYVTFKKFFTVQAASVGWD